MPLYSYKCKECGEIKDIKHKMDEAPEVKCEKCGAETKKIIQETTFIWNFYGVKGGNYS